MTSVNTNLYLDSSGQAQLAKLKAFNRIPLTRVESQVSQLKLRQPTLNTVKTEVAELKTAVQKLRDAPEAERADAINKFVKEFNDVQRQLTTTTDKEGTLRSFAGVRDARSAIRQPFSDIDVLTELRSAGIVTTRAGLEVTTVNATVDLSDAVLDKLMSTVDRVNSRLGSAESQITSRLSRLEDEKERVQRRVDAADGRTERSFLQYYQLLQQASSASAGGGAGMF